MDEIQELYKSKDFCLGQVREARKIFTNINTTRKEWEAMEQSLAFAYIYCPKELGGIILATLDESEKRKPVKYILAESD